MKLALLAAVPLLPMCAAAAQFTNGSLTGPVTTYSLVPSGWTNYNSGTSDTVSTAGHPFAGSFAGIGAFPYAASPNGGTFVFSAGYSGAPAATIPEGIVQTVTGMTPGAQYVLSFEFTNLALYDTATHIAANAFAAGYNLNSVGSWTVLANAATLGSTAAVAPVSVAGQQHWSTAQMLFTAPSNAVTFSFVATWVSGPGNFVGMGIDGISLAAVPELPAAPTLLAGLLAVGLWRRRLAHLAAP